MGAGVGAIPGEGFVGSVSACSRFGSEPALPLLPVRFLAHPAEKAQIGLYTTCGTYTLAERGRSKPKGQGQQPPWCTSPSTVLVYCLFWGLWKPGHSNVKTAYVTIDITGSSRDHKSRFPEGRFEGDSVLPGILAQYKEACSWVPRFPCDGWWDL